MAIPSLRFPMSVNMAGFTDGLNKARSHTRETVDSIAKEFAKMQAKSAIYDLPRLIQDNDTAKRITQRTVQAISRDIGSLGVEFTKWAAPVAIRETSAMLSTVALPAAKGFGAALLPLALRVGGLALSFVLLKSAINAAREQLQDMVDVADKARNFNVSPQFLQSFIAESNKLKVSTEDLESALSNAFEATKEKSPIDLGKWETGEERITAVEKALRVYNVQVKEATGQRLEGLVLFRDAPNQDQKIIAVLKAAIQLNEIGKKLEALDLAEKMFGSQFVDRIRQGKTTIEGMLQTVQTKSATAFSDEMVKRAKEVDDQLAIAQQRLSKELKPTWDELANAAMLIKSVWADIVGLIADAVNILTRFDIPSKLASAVPLINALILLKRIVESASPEQPVTDRPQITVTPSRGEGAAPTRTALGSTRDRFDASAESIEKRTAALEAETKNIDLNTAARERAKIAAELETVAMQINKEAGLGANVVTAEQRERIDAVAAAYGRAAEAIEKARSPLATFARESANVDKALNQFAAGSLDRVTDELAGVVTGTRSVADAFKAMAQSIINDLARIAIRRAITGPLAGLLSGALGGGIGSPGTFGGTGLPGFGGLYAEGGVIPPFGLGIIAEHSPGGPRMIRAGAEPIRVTPNDVARGGGGGDTHITYAPSYDARGADTTAVLRLAQEMAKDRAEFQGKVVSAIRNARRYSVI